MTKSLRPVVNTRKHVGSTKHLGTLRPMSDPDAAEAYLRSIDYAPGIDDTKGHPERTEIKAAVQCLVQHQRSVKALGQQIAAGRAPQAEE